MEKNGAMGKKEQRGGRSNKDEGATRRKKQRGGRSDAVKGATRRKSNDKIQNKIEKGKKLLEDALLTTSVLF